MFDSFLGLTSVMGQSVVSDVEKALTKFSLFEPFRRMNVWKPTFVMRYLNAHQELRVGLDNGAAGSSAAGDTGSSPFSSRQSQVSHTAQHAFAFLSLCILFVAVVEAMTRTAMTRTTILRMTQSRLLWKFL